MQIKMKPGKPTEPGDYVCMRKGSSRPEYARIWVEGNDLYFTAGISGFAMKHLEDDTLFSDRIDLVVEGENK